MKTRALIRVTLTTLTNAIGEENDENGQSFSRDKAIDKDHAVQPPYAFPEGKQKSDWVGWDGCQLDYYTVRLAITPNTPPAPLYPKREGFSVSSAERLERGQMTTVL